MAELRITLVRSLIGRPETERKTARALGLKKLHSQVVRPDTPATRGQVQKLAHLVQVENVE
ncbi:50S ribosomal protein L30 [Moorella sp. Hama-1]|uniref:50S ribosomal protein L30 n=1 Tax=Moorella sp. Hama-1 TaxID=2138101 RepID=UPI000D6548A0|nr:50S ribosomal protein L30 [Moorella sp. Hama-1]MDN5361310.1 large subunit ribosomal protein [Moorella sp. (in: firmicutes)]BCV23127.1 50S ribosomal protein L30 [Moorella sp. Hama-1]